MKNEADACRNFVLPRLKADTTAARFLTPPNLTTGKDLRHYQQNAVDLVVRSILAGQRGRMLTMASGTGKTLVAFQICWKLWSSGWTANGDSNRKPRILYLAERDFLVDDAKDNTFAAFGDARHKIKGGIIARNHELYFATYQSIAQDERRPSLYKEFAPDFFDLIIVDECHRGRAQEGLTWRPTLECVEIISYFRPAYRLGMTATLVRDNDRLNRHTYRYFGNSIFTYTGRRGIEDGYLAPFRIYRITTPWGVARWRLTKADLDSYSRELPEETYTTADLARRSILHARTQAVARHLTDFLSKTDRFAKTIVFCLDQEHAEVMRGALNQLNADLVAQFPDYVCRVTSDEDGVERGYLRKFQDVETRTPVILATSHLLTTGFDAPTCRNIVLVCPVNSLVEFKQIIGRGLRVREDYGKLCFNILDYTGAATRNFTDKSFDGDPCYTTEEEIDEEGEVKDTRLTPGLVHQFDADGKLFRVVKLPDYTGETVRSLCTDPGELRSRWVDAGRRATLIQQLAERGIDLRQVAAQAGVPDADQFDLASHLAFNLNMLTRRQRADRVKQKHEAFFASFTPDAREILNALLENYVANHDLQFTLPEVLAVPPISLIGDMTQVIGKFGDAAHLRASINMLQSLLYAW